MALGLSWSWINLESTVETDEEALQCIGENILLLIFYPVLSCVLVLISVMVLTHFMVLTCGLCHLCVGCTS